MKNKITWWLRFTTWLTYCKVRLVTNEIRIGRCVNCDANPDCYVNGYCPCKDNEHLKRRI